MRPVLRLEVSLRQLELLRLAVDFAYGDPEVTLPADVADPAELEPLRRLLDDPHRVGGRP